MMNPVLWAKSTVEINYHLCTPQIMQKGVLAYSTSKAEYGIDESTSGIQQHNLDLDLGSLAQEPWAEISEADRFMLCENWHSWHTWLNMTLMDKPILTACITTTLKIWYVLHYAFHKVLNSSLFSCTDDAVINWPVKLLSTASTWLPASIKKSWE
jgi:hypothetical protein